jgi:hypothetical protein
MWIFLLILGLVVGWIAVWLLKQGVFHEVPTSVTGERGGVSSPFPGVPLLIVAILIVIWATVFIRSSGGAEKHISSKPKPPAASTLPSNASTSTLSSTATPTETQEPTETVSPPVTSAETACAEAQPEPINKGPWEGCSQDVQLVVARLDTVTGRVRIKLRLENNSGDTITADTSAFLAIDDLGNQYKSNDEHPQTDWPDSEYNYGDPELEAGEILAGAIVLDDAIPANATALRVQFNFYKDNGVSYQYYTVDVTVPIPR